MGLHGWNTVAALATGALKAAHILPFVVELWRGPGLLRLVTPGGIARPGILSGGTLDDVLPRGWLAFPAK